MTPIKVIGCKKKTMWYYPLIGQTVNADWILGTNEPKGSFISQGVYKGDAKITSGGLTEDQMDLIENHIEMDEDERQSFEGYIDSSDFEK